MANDDFHLSTILGCEDDIDRKINLYTMGMVMGLNINNFILPEKAKWDDYATRIIELGTSLQKANNHLRKYKVEEKSFLTKYLQENSKKDQKTHSSTTAISLTSELDGFLSQYKASLDTLVKTFEPLFNIKLKTWGKKKDPEDSKEKSGLKVIDALNRNFPEKNKHKIEPLIQFIRENIEWVSHNVDLRDSASHHGGLKNVSNVLYNYKERKVYPQVITHSNQFSETVVNYIDRTMDELVDYVTMVLILSLQAKAPGDMFIQENPEKEFPYFSWSIRLPRTS
jgi:hypothetical protein